MAIVSRFTASNLTGSDGDFARLQGALASSATQNGVTATIEVAFDTAGSFADGWPASHPVYSDFPRATFQRHHFLNASEPQIRYSGLSPNTQYAFRYQCASPTTDQRNVIIGDGATTVEYIDALDYTSSINDNVVLVSTSDGSGEVLHTLSKGSFTAAGSHAFDSVIIDDDPTAGQSPQVDADASTSPGDTINFTVSGFGGTINSATLGDGTSAVTLTSPGDTSAVLPALGNDIQYTTFGADRTYTVGDGTDTATDSVDLDPPAGHNLVTLSAGPNTGATSWLYNYGGTPDNPDQSVYNPIASDTGATLTLNSDGSWSSTGSGTWPDIFVIDASDGWMDQITLTAVGITSSPIQVAPGASYSIVLDLEVTVSSVTLDGVTQTIASQSSAAGETTVNLTAVQGDAKFANTLSLVANITGGGMADADINLVPIAANGFVNVTSLSQQDNSIFIAGRLDTGAVGDQVEWDDAANTSIAADGTITQNTLGDFNARLWDASTGTWGAWTVIQNAQPRIVSVSPTVLEANESFTVTLDLINANDVRSVAISDGTTDWKVPVDSVINATSFSATAPSDLPSGATLTFAINESKDARAMRELYVALEQRVAALETP